MTAAPPADQPAPLPWHALPPAEVAAALATDAGRGLAPAEAAARLARVGPNRLRTVPGPSLLARLARQVNDPLIGVLLAAAVIAGALGEWIDAVAIVAIVALNAALSLVQEERAERALRALQQLAAPAARVVRDGVTRTLPAAEVVPGDLLEVEAGDRLAADARLVEAYALTVDEATLTGESLPVEKEAAAVLPAETPLAERVTMLYAGTLVTTGHGRALVTATGMSTELGRLAGLVQAGGLETTPLQRRLSQVGRWLVYVALGVCAAIFGLGLARGIDPAEMFLTAVSLAVAAVPEGLPAVVTLVLALGTQRLARRRAIVRRLPAVETLGSTTVICSDKTGTLTQNVMSVRAVWWPGAAPAAFPTALEAGGQRVLRAAVLASTARLERAAGVDGAARGIGDPTEVALLRAAEAAGIALEPAAHGLRLVHVLPFDSGRRRMTRLFAPESVDGGVPLSGLVAYVKGAPDRVLAICTRARRADGTVVALDPALAAAARAVNDQLAEDGLRVLAVAERPDSPLGDIDEVEADLTLLGLVGLQDPPRPEAAAAVAACRAAGIRPVMITGDQPRTARVIGRELGLLQPEDWVVTGAELDALDDVALQEALPRISAYARVSGEHKLRIVRAWRRRGEVVAMTGDGVNDAPALREADIGIAMGITGTDVTKEAGDIVLADDNFATIVAAVEEGRAIADNIRKVLRFLLSCNAAEIGVMIAAVLLNLPLPLLAVQILWMNLVTDGLPALALGAEPPERDVMRRPPVRPGAPLLRRAAIRDLLIEAALMVLATLAALLLALAGGLPVETARTMAFTTLVLAQLWQAFNCRSEVEPLLRLGIGSNPRLLQAVGLAVLLQLGVVYLPPAWPIFHTEPLAPAQLLACLALSAIVWPAVELRKFVLPRWRWLAW
jgi:Ca2+-transporting ATPase